MRLKKIGEWELIEAIRRRHGRPQGGVALGIGDDAAAVRASGANLLLTMDLLIEDQDFIRLRHPPRLLGRKSMNVNLSDIAAMGGRPLYTLLGLGLPSDIELDWLVDYLAGFGQAAREHGVALIGGDLSESKKIVAAVTVVGAAARFIRRDGAEPGHMIFVSGYLGDARQGFLIYKRSGKPAAGLYSRQLLKAFLDPVPWLKLGLALSRLRLASAMIDCSDGLSTDLGHICEESGVGAEVETARLPVSPALRAVQKAPLPLALHGGEDFGLIFTVAPGNVAGVLKLRRRFLITEIGRITPGRGILTVDENGRKKILERSGFEHFK
jgi:thiamine-monophosphate kinase